MSEVLSGGAEFLGQETVVAAFRVLLRRGKLFGGNGKREIWFGQCRFAGESFSGGPECGEDRGLGGGIVSVGCFFGGLISRHFLEELSDRALGFDSMADLGGRTWSPGSGSVVISSTVFGCGFCDGLFFREMEASGLQALDVSRLTLLLKANARLLGPGLGYFSLFFF